MELSIDPETAERIARGVLGVLSFIALIVWCRWRGTPQDQEKDEPAQGAGKKRTPNVPAVVDRGERQRDDVRG